MQKTVKFHYPLRYHGSILILILLCIIWLPLGLLLFLKNGVLRKDQLSYSFAYNGRFGWLIFWAIICFPVALVLLFINGADLVEEEGKTLH